MGYDIHITRADDWTESDSAGQITGDEWLAYVERDPELKLAGYNGPYFALWLGESQRLEPWFSWAHGEVMTKNPDSSLVTKAIAIAQALGARVQGDDGEIYLPEGRVERDGVIDNRDGMDWRAW